VRNATTTFVERRKEFRLPYEEKVIFSDGEKSLTAYASNLSRGGVFVTSLEPFAIDTQGYLSFFLPSQSQSLCVRARVVHVVFDRQRCEIDCGMGIYFSDLTEAQKSILNLHLLNEQVAYIELKKLLASSNPNSADIARCLKKLPALKRHDLLWLRYKVNRICTILESAQEMGSAPAESAAPLKKVV
jgi:Tfp pilus assembly protein PilZ